MTQSRNDVPGEYSEAVEVTRSDYHRLLSTERRRHAIEVLMERSAPVDLDDLAVAVAEREDGSADEETVERVMTTLHHVHLPMMVEADVIAYDIHETRVASCPSRADLPF